MTTPGTTPKSDATDLSNLPPQYNPADVEPAMRDRWDAAKAWHAEPTDAGDPYSVVIPPPNVTAALHLGHALNNTLQDVLVRYHRMRGRNTMWMPGTDHAGIATQTVVDKRLQATGQKSLKDYKIDEAEGKPGREAFIAKVEAWKDEYEARIVDQLKEMGASCDWDRQRFTMDEQCATAVREAFFRLFKDGLIYRGKRLVNWDPVTQTALADDEVEMQDVDGHFWYMKYPVVDADGNATGEFATVATTRPETMLGDTAVAVNPEDPNNSAFIGKRVKLPIVGRIIPIVGDDYVVIPDPDSDDGKARMASGFLKVTPAHDTNDYEIGQRHDLPVINIMAPDASISKDHGWSDWDACDAAAIEPLLGLSREDARRAIVRWFKEQDLLAEQKPYRHAVGHSYRSHVPVEPYYTDQWYVKVTDDRLAGAALRAMAPDQRQASEGCTWKEGDPFAPGSTHGQEASDAQDKPRVEPGAKGEEDWAGKLRFYPDRYAKTFQSWHENIRDWCISRQLWWGHRISVWRRDTARKEPMPGLEAFVEQMMAWSREGRVAVQYRGEVVPLQMSEKSDLDLTAFFICVRDPDNDREVIETLESHGIVQDPDVLDTWFSSGLWPLSTMGWPNVDGNEVLATWNPTQVLSTAREIITLWVSRMVMFNTYFHSQLPYHDVFIHAMIQDGHGQKMSKSLGNGVDPSDIIHTHGSDAMRYVLTAMTTNTQDVRMPVDCLDPATGDTVTPKFITGPGGYKVMAPTQEYKGKTFGTSYGVASGELKPDGELPVARNTSEKFDLGQRFANKLWNATRFALSNLTPTDASPDASVGSSQDLGPADKWILSRLARTIRAANDSLKEYQFAPYAQALYDFIWRDLCDWYIEAIKGTVQDDAAQRNVLATCIDASLRLLHPVMPFVTERLWEGLNATVPQRGVDGLTLPGSDLLMTAAWPRADSAVIDEAAEEDFELIRSIVAAVRELRSAYNLPPRQKLETTCKAPGPLSQKLLAFRDITCTLANTVGCGVGPGMEKPDDAAVVVVGDCELYVHGLIDADAERERLTKRKDELEKSVANFDKRLANKSYVDKAPAKLVQETRDQRAEAARELEAVASQLEALG